MQTAVRLNTTVLPGKRIELSSPELPEGAAVEVIVLWQATEEERQRRAEAVRRIDELRDRLFAVHGEMPDSTDLIRDDRGR
jgi:hypothetical protein